MRFSTRGMWESLVIRLAWDQENAGSNPVIPTLSMMNEVCDADTT